MEVFVESTIQKIIDNAEYKRIPVASIQPSSEQPREVIDLNFVTDLAQSTQKMGQLVPVIVRPLLTSERRNGYLYELIDGEQRWQGIKKAGLTMINATIVNVVDKKQQFLISVVANVQRATLTPLEIALSVKKLMAMDLSQREIAVLFKKSQAWVQVRHSLLELESEVLDLAGPKTPPEKRLSHMQAYILVGIPRDKQIEYARVISEQQLSVTEARKFVADKIRSESVKVSLANTSRLCAIEDLKKFTSFIKRTNEYLDNLLALEEGRFEDVFQGDVEEHVRQYKEAAKEASRKFETMSKRLEAVEKKKNVIGSELLTKTHFAGPFEENKRYFGRKLELWPTTRLLRMLGVTGRNLLYAKRAPGEQRKIFSSLWTRPINHLAVLEAAKRLYKTKMTQCHPDVGGKESDAKRLNLIWDLIQIRFKSHGYELE